jgi:hypothetical protein
VFTAKTEAMYTRFFEVIRGRLPNWVPDSITSDFERAALNAISTVYPASEKTGCLFHYGQALMRKVREFPFLRQQSEASEDFHTQVKTLHSLSFVPPEWVPFYFAKTMDSLNAMAQHPEILGSENVE